MSRLIFAVYLSVFCLSFLGVSLTAQASSGFDLKKAQARCAPAVQNEPYVSSDDFEWYITMERMGELFESLYNSPKRLYGRAYFDVEKKRFVLPKSHFDEVKPVLLTENFLKSVTLHIETALKLGYVNYPFFPDMGHSHVHIPMDVWTERISKYSIEDTHLLYQDMLSEPRVKFLYHTAEQLKMHDEDRKLLDDRFVQWRFYTRNLVGDNMARGQFELHFDPNNVFNTTRGEEGYRYWGAGLNLHASQNGCFPYKHQGRTYYFDISLESLPVSWDPPEDSEEGKS